MPIIILKTDLKTDQRVDAIRPIFNLHPAIKNWNVDTEDIDNVLRIESVGKLTDIDIINLLNSLQIKCQNLP